MPSSLAESREALLAAGTHGNPGRWAILIFLLFNFFYLLTSGGRVRTPDEYMALFETESLVLRQSTAVPQALQANYFYGKYDLHGQPRVPYPPGHPLFAAPWYLVGHAALERWMAVPQNASPFLLGAVVCFSSASFSAAVVAFFFLIARALGSTLRASFLAAAIVGLATPVFAYSAWFFSEPLTTALMVAAAYFIFARHVGELVPIPSAAIGGVLLGIAVFVRPAHALAATVFFTALVLRDRTKALVPASVLAAFSACGLAALFFYNFHLYGNPFEFGYPAVAEGGKRLNSFETPILTGLFGFLFSPGKSVFLFAPPILLGIAGIPRLWHKDRGLAVVASATLPVYLLFYARYSQWEGGYCVGPRYMVPALTLLCLGLMPVLARFTQPVKRAAIALSILGLAVQLVSIATSFMESQVPPGAYYGPNWTYRMSYSIGSQLRILLHHLSDHTPAKLGLGFDRWFLFLAKAGVGHGSIAVLFCGMLLGFIFSALSLQRSLARSG